MADASYKPLSRPQYREEPAKGVARRPATVVYSEIDRPQGLKRNRPTRPTTQAIARTEKRPIDTPMLLHSHVVGSASSADSRASECGGNAEATIAASIKAT
jgi:hypothetical protein